jgi:hypothetical protein
MHAQTDDAGILCCGLQRTEHTEKSQPEQCSPGWLYFEDSESEAMMEACLFIMASGER